MKRLILFLFVLSIASVVTAQNDAIEKYFSKYIDDERFTVVYISPKMFSMVAKMDIEDMDPEVKDIISDLEGLRILTTEFNTNSLYNEAMKTIDMNEYELLMKVRDGEENVHFLVKEGENDKIRELLLLVGGNDQFVLLSFVGNIDLSKISKLANSMDIDGFEHLEKIDEK